MWSAIEDWLVGAYPWIKALHVISVISWMAALLYLPRLFVYHAERAPVGSETGEIFKVMERKLLKIIANPASIATWVCGMLLVLTPGVVDWGAAWSYVKAAGVILLTLYHHLLVRWWRDFALDRNRRGGRFYRLANEVPTVLMIIVVVMVVARPF